MLEYFPNERASAEQMLEHYWLAIPVKKPYKMKDAEFERYMETFKSHSWLDKFYMRNEADDQEAYDADTSFGEANDSSQEEEAIPSKSGYNKKYQNERSGINVQELDRPEVTRIVKFGRVGKIEKK